MATGATTNFQIPLFGDADFVTPIQTPLNAQSNALDAALTKAAFVTYPTYSAMNLVAGTVVGQHATVNADPIPALNGDYSWNGTAWTKRVPGGRVIRSSKAATFGSGWNLLGGDATYWTPSQAAYQMPAFDGTWVVPIGGLWHIEAGVLLDATVNVLLIIKKNSAAASNAGAILGGGFIGQGTFTAASVSGTVVLNAGDVIRAAILPSVGSAAWNTALPDMSFFGIRYVETLA